MRLALDFLKNGNYTKDIESQKMGNQKEVIRCFNWRMIFLGSSDEKERN